MSDRWRASVAVLVGLLAAAAATSDREGLLTVGTETLHLTLPEAFAPEAEPTAGSRSINYLHVIDGDMDVRQGGVQIRGEPGAGTSLDRHLARLLADSADRCQTKPAVDELKHFTDAGLPALGALVRCGPASAGQAGYVIVLKLIHGRQAQFVVVRGWQVDAEGPAAAMPYTDAMRADATAVMDSAHVCARKAACR